jgi:CRISPR-associated exonuclease Cas4
MNEATIAENQVFTVSDLKQYAYCPRVVYYTYCLPLLRPETYTMRESVREHEEEAGREERRSLRLYGLPEGERRYDVAVYSGQLGLRGRVDLLIESEGELIPVDYKLSERQASAHFRLQLAAYGLMLSEAGPGRAERGFLYSIPLRRAEEIRFTSQLTSKVRRLAAELREMVAREVMPEAAAGRGRCLACEFRRFCNDM